MASVDWTAALAFVTGTLAAATVWLALEQRKGRIDSERNRVRITMRGALAEQLENMRRLHGRDPSRGQPALLALRASAPTFDRIGVLIREVNLPTELAAYLIWLVGETQQRWTSFEGLLDDVAPADGSVGRVHATNSTVHSDWKLILERIQIAGCLVAAELARLGFGADAAIVDRVAWTVSAVWPAGMRATTRVSEGIYFDGPPFPGAAAYAGCSPNSRDAQAAATQASVPALPTSL
jgi:hypothetical protein